MPGSLSWLVEPQEITRLPRPDLARRAPPPVDTTYRDSWRMNNWIRLIQSEGLVSESWHLQFAISPRGMRVSECGAGYPPADELETRPFWDPPAEEDSCAACHLAYVRSSRGTVPAPCRAP